MKNNIKTLFPQFFIKNLLENTVKELLGDISWEPRVVRQNKLVENSLLEFIDYAVPCFDLSKLINKSSNQIAKQISDKLNEHLTSFERVLDYRTEAISGYVNIQLSRVYINDSLKEAIKWYTDPFPLFEMPPNINYLVIGAGLGQDSGLGTTDNALYYIQQLYKSYSTRSLLDYLYSDYSIEAINLFQEFFISKQESKGHKQYELTRDDCKLIKKFFAGDTRVEVNGVMLLDLYKKFSTDSIVATRNNLDNIGIDNYLITSEYKHEKQVSEYLEAISSKNHKGFLCDSSTKAIFYTYNNDAIPLRSANGILYEYAFIMFSLEKKIEKCVEDNTPLIIIGSHRIDLVVSEMLRSIIDRKKSNVRVTYFDPRVSKADIAELMSKTPKLPGLYKEIITVLDSVNDEMYSNIKKRQALLKLIDITIVVDSSLKEFQMPSIFDALNQSREAIEQLT
jgi:hypothetical protein